MKEWITVKELAEIQGITPRAVRKAVSNNKYITRTINTGTGVKYEILVQSLNNQIQNCIDFDKANGRGTSPVSLSLKRSESEKSKNEIENSREPKMRIECVVPTHAKQIGLEEDAISIISCNGISYFHYLNAIQDSDKRIAVLTDNDANFSKIEKVTNFNTEHTIQKIFMSNDTNNEWTWEACFYHSNKSILDDLIEVDSDSDYLFHKVSYGKVLGKMLNNKVDTAYKMLESEKQFVIPQYIKDAITWLNE